MYHVSVHKLAERVMEHIRRDELLRPGDRVGVAVSGGIDSVALLRLLLELRSELGIVLSVVHFNHKLRGAESEADQQFVKALARAHGLEFYVDSGDTAGLAAQDHSGVEAAARRLRYGFFGELLGVEGELENVDTSGAKAQSEAPICSAESAAPPQSLPPGLKPDGEKWPLRGAEAPLFHGTEEPLLRRAEAVPLQNSDSAAARVAFQGQNQHSILNKIVTGHTLDDQAETVLMRLIRGTGLRGLGGIYPRIAIEGEVSDNEVSDNDDDESHGEIVRPLLGIRRRELQSYLDEIKQPWREDSSNSDSKFTRNRVRGLVLPLLEREFNPAVAEGLAELAEIARDEEDYWENEISGWLGTVVQWSRPDWTRGLPGFESSQLLVQILPSQAKTRDPDLLARLEQPGPAIMDASVSRPWLLTEPRAVQRRVLKAIGERAGIPLEFKHVEEILRFAEEDGPSGKELSLPMGWRIVREPEVMVFRTPDLRRQERIPDYEYVLRLPGRALVPELGIVIEALRLPPDSELAEYNPQQLLRTDLLPGQLMVRNWRAGDRFWPAHTKEPKKIKELLQERHVPQPERRLWPVAASEREIVWMRGFPVAGSLRAKPGQEAVLIRETPWAVEG